MDGFVLNKTTMWAHALKRSIGPGQKVSLEELYDQYGKKHGLERGEEFIQWLKTIKLKDAEKWAVVFDTKEQFDALDDAKNFSPKDIRTITTAEEISPKKMSVGDVSAMSVRKAREVLPQISDINILKYALQEANQLSGRDSLCRLLRRRIGELQTVSRS
jgi:hypothetical protein